MPSIHRLVFSLLASVALAPGAAAAQEQTPPGSLRAFLDCQTFGCDFDHFRREIVFVDWVRDREDAEVHILVTSQSSGSGRSYDISFIGRGRFVGDDADLVFSSSDTDTDNERRDGLTSVVQLGLVRYASLTEVADRLTVDFRSDESETGQLSDGGTTIDDPWDFWVFRVSAGGEYDAESQQRASSFFGSVSANRTTEALKIRVTGSIFYQEDQFDFEDETFTSIARSNNASVYTAFSIGSNYATGLRYDIWSSTFRNIDLANRGAWAFEYNVFPYSESTRRELTATYALGVNDLRYLVLTIYEKTEEVVFDHSMNVELNLTQPWGDARASARGRQFLHDPGLWSLSASAGLDVRLFRGLSLDFGAFYSAVRDQLSLRAGDASPEEILLFRRELATDFRFGTSLRLTFRFGSIFNNVVNPRLENFRRP